MSLNRKPGQSTPSVQTAARHSLEEMEVDPFPQRCWLFHIRIDAVVDTQRGRERERDRERERSRERERGQEREREKASMCVCVC